MQAAVSSDLKPGDIVKMKKPHPCGANCWEIIRIGMDFKARCCECERLIEMKRRKFERAVVEVLERGDN